MQILNISVQNRPNKSLTSRPYAMYIMEVMQGSIDIDDVVVNMPYELSEYMSSKFDFDDMQYIKEVTYRTLTVPQEFMTSTVDFDDINILKEDTYTTYEVGYDSMESSINVADPVIRVALVTRKIDVGLMWSNFTVDDIQILEDK